MGRLFCEEGQFWIKLYRGRIGQNSYWRFFLFIVLSLCQFNFACGDVPAEIFSGNLLELFEKMSVFD